MKINELTEQMEEILKEVKIEKHFRSTFGQLRIMGLLYEKFMYKKELKSTKKKYTSEQVLEATKMSLDFYSKVDFTKITDEKHVVNTFINAIAKQLEWHFYNEDELDNALDMEL